MMLTATMPSTTPLLSTPPATLLALRAAMLTRPDLDTVFTLRDAGYAGGDAVYSAFETFVREQDRVDPQGMDAEQFLRRAGEFFTQRGWGETLFSNQDDTFCVVEIENCWEADAAHQPDPRGCHLTLGMLGAFLGKFADYPVAVLEVEGPATGSQRCRFIAGTVEMVGEYYEKES